MTLDDSDETRIALYVGSAVFRIVAVSVFFSMVVPDIIEDNKWNLQPCNVLNSSSLSYTCCTVTCSSNQASSCSVYSGTCILNTLLLLN
jgi:hypothetical protein